MWVCACQYVTDSIMLRTLDQWRRRCTFLRHRTVSQTHLSQTNTSVWTQKKFWGWVCPKKGKGVSLLAFHWWLGSSVICQCSFTGCWKGPLFSKLYSVYIVATGLITHHAKCWTEWSFRFALRYVSVQSRIVYMGIAIVTLGNIGCISWLYLYSAKSNKYKY